MEKRWLNERAFRSTFNQALSFLRNYVPWVPRSEEEMGANGTLVFYIHMHTMYTLRIGSICALSQMDVCHIPQDCSEGDWGRI